MYARTIILNGLRCIIMRDVYSLGLFTMISSLVYVPLSPLTVDSSYSTFPILPFPLSKLFLGILHTEVRKIQRHEAI